MAGLRWSILLTPSIATQMPPASFGPSSIPPLGFMLRLLHPIPRDPAELFFDSRVSWFCEGNGKGGNILNGETLRFAVCNQIMLYCSLFKKLQIRQSQPNHEGQGNRY